MKRIVCLLMAVLLLSGCASAAGNIKEPVEFFYLRNVSKTDDQKTYFSEGAFAFELREATGRRDDLYYLLSMYLNGPLDPDLLSLFPGTCSLVQVKKTGPQLTVRLNGAVTELEGMDLTLACACLAQTCMGLAEVTSVRIESVNADNKVLFSTTITSDSLLLTEAAPTTEPTQ